MGTEKKNKPKQKRTEGRVQALQECCCSSSPTGVLAAVLTELHGTGYSSDVWGAVGAQTLGNSLSSRFFLFASCPSLLQLEPLEEEASVLPPQEDGDALHGDMYPEPQ